MFTNLGIKTDYSLFKSLIKLDDLIRYAKDKNIKSLGILDDNLCGSHMFITECIKNDIKPIVGLDIKIENIRMFLYPTNMKGLTFLFKVTKKQIDSDLTFKDIINDNLLYVLPFESGNAFKKLSGIFNNLYMSFASEAELNKIKTITNNYIYINETKAFTSEQSKYINYLYMIENNIKLGEYEFVDYSKNIMKEEKYDLSDFVNKIDLKQEKSGNHIPKYDPNIKDSFEYLSNLANKGLSKRLDGKVTSVYQERLDYELKKKKKLGFVDYFLIVFDYVRYALKNNIMVGCGRGSAVGSLVAYSLGITRIDPIEYNLLFERFLNPERVTMPDIDIDFEDERREEVVQYVINKYGVNNVVHIMTYGRLTAKEVIRSVAKINHLDEKLIDGISNLLDSKKSLKDNLNDKLKSLIKRNSSVRKVFEESLYLEGIKNQIGIHAAGIVISDTDLTDNIPVIKNGDIYLSGYQMGELESLGLLKMDFLSVADLTLIKKVVNLVEEKENIKINIDNIPLDEPKVYELLTAGLTEGIFQFKTPSMKNYLRRAKVSKFEDLIMAQAINRPGPMSNIPVYLARKNEGRKIDYLFPELESILSETYGIMIYQEQVMQVLRTIAGYSYGEADVIRRAISKKKLDVIEKEKINFINRSVEKGFDKERVEKLYNQIVEFADYGFNKSHSIAYSKIAYQMAYLKALYPGYFYLTLLNQGSRKESIIYEAKGNNISIVKADINISSNEYVYKDNSIILSFKAIRGITDSIASTIVEARGNKKFTDIYDFFARVKNINKKNLTILIEAGVFDSLNVNRATIIKNIDSLLTYGDLIQTLSKDLVSEPELKEVEEFDDTTLMNKEYELYGFYVSNHPCSKYNCFKQKDIKKYYDKFIEMVVLVDRIKTLKTKNNDDMAFITYEDETGEGDAVVFKEAFDSLADIKEKDLVKVVGHVERRMDKFQLVIKSISKEV